MNLKNELIREFELRVFDESYNRIYKCFQMISDEDLWNSPNENIPSIGNLVLHLCGNARQWILSGIGEKPDNRDRDLEFVKHKNIKKSDLVFLLENLKTNIKETFKDCSDHKLEQQQSIQGFKVNGVSIIIHVLEHFSYHTGQITTLTKILKNKQTGYYSNLDLNQLNNLN